MPHGTAHLPKILAPACLRGEQKKDWQTDNPFAAEDTVP
jgi:hypothetical protein